MEEERFALDNNDNVLDFEDKTDEYCLSQEDVCNLLNKQQKRIAELEKDLEFTTKTHCRTRKRFRIYNKNS